MKKHFLQKLPSLERIYNKEFLVFIIIFFVSKLIPFVTPLLASNFLKRTEDYGRIEYLLNAGSLISSFFLLGLSSAYPYFNITLKKSVYKPFILHFSLIFFYSVFFIIAILIFPSANISKLLFIGTIFGAQLLFSAILKSEQKSSWAVILDGGILSILLCYICYLYFTHTDYLSELVFLSLLFLYSIILVFTSLSFLRNKNKDVDSNVTHENNDIIDYKKVLLFSFPVFISSLLIATLTTSNRVLIEYFLDLKAVAYYSFYFRIVSILVIVYQAIMILLFRKLYAEHISKLDKMFLQLLVSFIFISALILLLFPFFLLPYFKIYQETSHYLFPLLYILSAQMFFWIVTALLENIIYREKVTKTLNFYLLAIILSVFATCYLFDHLNYLSLITISTIQCFGVYVYSEIQIFLIKKKTDVSLRRVRIINRFVFLATITFIIYNLVII